MRSLNKSFIFVIMLVTGCYGSFASVRGYLTVGGLEQVSSAGLWDSGTVTVTINSTYSKAITYGQYSTPTSVASAIAGTISLDNTSPAVAHSIGAQVTFVMKGSATTLASLVMSSTHSTGAFQTASFYTANPLPSVGASGFPVITGLLMTNSTVGSAVTLNGINFGPAGTVTFNGIPATPTVWSPSSIVVPIPAGATSGPIVVTTYGMFSNSVSITITSAVSCPIL